MENYFTSNGAFSFIKYFPIVFSDFFVPFLSFTLLVFNVVGKVASASKLAGKFFCKKAARFRSVHFPFLIIPCQFFMSMSKLTLVSVRTISPLCKIPAKRSFMFGINISVGTVKILFKTICRLWLS